MNAILQAADQYSDQMWRLHNLYWIVDKQAKKVLFKPNVAQLELLKEMWWRTDILKARQFGFTTMIDIYLLDTALFNDNIAAGIIAHNLVDAAKIFDTKVKFPYDNLPEGIKAAVSARSDTKRELIFSNGSMISVGTSFRSGTVNMLHISEYGKIAAKYPEKAREIKTGAIEAVPASGMLFVESTAEGRFGEFYERIKRAREIQDSGKELTQLDSKFFFMPWWKSHEYRIDQAQVVTKEMRDYFTRLEHEHGIELDKSQKNWYIVKERALGEDMKREYPSTPDEAFEASVEGAYWSKQMAMARKERRIGRFPALPDVPVRTWWDIGRDTTSIWLTQDDGKNVRIIHYYQNSGEGMKHYAKALKEIAEERDLIYEEHNYPHDMDRTEWGTDRHRLEIADKLGIGGNALPRMEAKENGIEAGRSFIPICLFDEEHCADGIAGLTNYRKKWNEELGTWSDTPLHDGNSHPADAFQQLALYHEFHDQLIMEKHFPGATVQHESDYDPMEGR